MDFKLQLWLQITKAGEEMFFWLLNVSVVNSFTEFYAVQKQEQQKFNHLICLKSCWGQLETKLQREDQS
jgi:glucose-6-phosphate isomerase